jgi:hypothetical protein
MKEGQIEKAASKEAYGDLNVTEVKWSARLARSSDCVRPFIGRPLRAGLFFRAADRHLPHDSAHANANRSRQAS